MKPDQRVNITVMCPFRTRPTGRKPQDAYAMLVEVSVPGIEQQEIESTTRELAERLVIMADKQESDLAEEDTGG